LDGIEAVGSHDEGGQEAAERVLEVAGHRPALASLTRREQEVALLAAQGMSKREIADTLFLSVRTIGNHINHVYTKLGIGSREELRLALHVAGTEVPTAHETDR